MCAGEAIQGSRCLDNWAFSLSVSRMGENTAAATLAASFSLLDTISPMIYIVTPVLQSNADMSPG